MVNKHYYSIFIPDSSDNIIIEIQKNNIFSDDIYFYAKEGIVKINTNKMTKNTLFLNEFIQKNSNDKILINLNCSLFNLNDFENKYISFTFITTGIYYSVSYYFRIVQKNPIDKFMIFPLNINKPNLCNTYEEAKDKYSCFFLINNEYREIGNEFIVYGYGQKKVEHISWLFYDDDSYSIDFNNINKENNFTASNNYLIINTNDIILKPNFILIKLESYYPEVLTIITNYYQGLENTYSIEVYSYKIFFLKEEDNIYFDFNFDIFDKYRLIMNNINGTGEICFNQFCNSTQNKNKTEIFQNNVMSYFITKDITKIDIKTSNFLVFNLKIDYLFNKSILKEINFQSDFRTSENDFPIAYYLKEVEFRGADINLYFKFNNNIDALHEIFITFNLILF